MTERVATAEQAENLPKPKRESLFGTETKTKLKTAAVLSATAIAATIGEHYGVDKMLPHGLREVATSLRHPAVGFLGAFVADKVSRSRLFKKKDNDVAMGIGATVANFATETAQGQVIFHEYFQYLGTSKLPETTKDYVFALAGAAIYKKTMSKK
ncbi:hypothetical protein HY004_03115 [Candidatus Saccharibacteria bacterium]|nr:hypothetical protein [Candidatus Saccharibacteria bacterium]